MDRCVLAEKAGKKESEQLCALACKLEARWTAGAGQQIGKQVVLPPPSPLYTPTPSPSLPRSLKQAAGYSSTAIRGSFGKCRPGREGWSSMTQIALGTGHPIHSLWFTPNPYIAKANHI